MLRVCAIALFLPCILAASPAQADRLVSQSVDGTRRICIYDSGYGAVARRPRIELTADPRDRVEVGIGQPCPPRRLGEDEEAEESAMSPMAILREEDFVDGQRICRYSYAGIDYERPAEPQRSCTLTPNF